MSEFTELEEALQAADDYEALAPPMRQIAAMAGMSHFAALRLRGANFEHLVQIVHNSPSSHAEQLQQAAYWHRSPTLQKLLRASPPLMYEGNVNWEAPADVPGFEHGVAYASSEERGALILFLARAAPAVAREELLAALRTVAFAAPMLLTCFERLHLKACPLSMRQLDCLRHIMAGFNAEETATALDIGPRTVEQYLERARAHLGTATSLATAVVAIDQGWMKPSQVFDLARARAA